ncbi:MAG: penicillin-binding transpeptidase domain-containing protein [bacterium]|nr:penicillin-binding transpeptidase domain-containing protein [bacterium]
MALKYRVYIISLVFTILLLTPLIHLVRYQVIEADSILAKPNELRGEQTQELRGSLLDRQGQALAYSEGRARIYPLGEAAGSLVGYCGSDGLDNSFSGATKALTVPREPIAAIQQISKGDLRGDDVVLTIDSQLQQRIYDLLSGYLGAAVVMDVRTGELLALVSRPSYDNNRVSESEYWQSLMDKASSSPLMERCLQSRYPPGSTFKTIVMSGALEEGLTRPGEQFDCSGSMDVGNFVLNCNATHGKLNLTEAFAYSCNMAFASVGMRLGVAGIDKWARRFGFMDIWPDVPGAAKAHLASDTAPSSAAEAAIGQADFLVSPLHMALTASVIANKGRLLEPHLYKGSMRRGLWTQQIEIKDGREVISAETAVAVAEAMRQTVQYGTCTLAALSYTGVAGKSGSAENPQGDPHAWFIGYAPYDNPRIACAVVLENAGSGGTYAAPVARQILDLALNLTE